MTPIVSRKEKISKPDIEEKKDSGKEEPSNNNEEAEKSPTSLNEFIVWAALPKTRYIIKNTKKQVVKQGQGRKTFNLPNGNYEITFFNKNDTSEYLLSLPGEEIVMLEF